MLLARTGWVHAFTTPLPFVGFNEIARLTRDEEWPCALGQALRAALTAVPDIRLFVPDMDADPERGACAAQRLIRGRKLDDIRHGPKI